VLLCKAILLLCAKGSCLKDHIEARASDDERNSADTADALNRARIRRLRRRDVSGSDKAEPGRLSTRHRPPYTSRSQAD
jgi:hypothetical protein